MGKNHGGLFRALLLLSELPVTCRERGRVVLRFLASSLPRFLARVAVPRSAALSRPHSIHPREIHPRIDSRIFSPPFSHSLSSCFISSANFPRSFTHPRESAYPVAHPPSPHRPSLRLNRGPSFSNPRHLPMLTRTLFISIYCSFRSASSCSACSACSLYPCVGRRFLTTNGSALTQTTICSFCLSSS